MQKTAGKSGLECRARPNLPEIRLFWTSTWGEEDRVLVDLDASPSGLQGGCKAFWGFYSKGASKWNN